VHIILAVGVLNGSVTSGSLNPTIDIQSIWLPNNKPKKFWSAGYE